ncbi:MAG: hypothetical protein M3268_02870, partial [Acidobacteriota bacterium]|nr:hypothetical protein [Acidobacteriota bacterium]
DHYDISLQVGERVLLPAVRSTPKGALVISDGFSCREQIAQETDRRALHLAEVIELALHDARPAPVGDYPEKKYLAEHAQDDSPTAAEVALMIGAGALVAGGLAWGLKALLDKNSSPRKETRDDGETRAHKNQPRRPGTRGQRATKRPHRIAAR